MGHSSSQQVAKGILFAEGYSFYRELLDNTACRELISPGISVRSEDGRHLGVTGRFCPEGLMECIRRFPFDSVLLGVNTADKYYYGFEKDLLPLAVEKQMGIIGMKVMARG